MDQEQLVQFAQKLFLLSIVGGMAGCVLMNGIWLALGGLFSMVAAFFESRNRIENARKRAALFSRLAVKSQAEYDRLLVELATGKASAAGGVVGRACETHDAASAGAQAVALPLTAREA